MERVRFGSTKFKKKMKYNFRLSASQIARISCYGTVKKPVNVKYVFFLRLSNTFSVMRVEVCPREFTSSGLNFWKILPKS